MSFSSPPSTPPRGKVSYNTSSLIAPSRPKKHVGNLDSKDEQTDNDYEFRVLHHSKVVSASTSPLRRLASISVLTWNVWFDSHRQADRYTHLLTQLIKWFPDVACFQEVTTPFIKALKSNTDITDVYHLSDNRIASYGILTLVKKDIASEIEIEEIQLKSNMDRTLLVVKIPVSMHPQLDDTRGDDDRFFIHVGNVHLESLDNESFRRQQLITCRDYLTKNKMQQSSSDEAHTTTVAAMLVGDFNFDSSQTWGDWDHNHPKYPKEHLENNVLDEIMPNWVDVWPYLKGAKEPGHTFDGATNVCVRNKKEIMRYDRIMVKIDTDFKLLVPHQIEMIGTESIDETGLMASDHYGLLVKLNVCTPLT